MYLAQALRYLAPLLLVPFYGRILGVATYGHLLSAMALMQVAWVIVEWGLPMTGLRDVAAAKTATEQGCLVGEQILARLALGALVVPVCFLVVLFTPVLAKDMAVTSLALLLGLVNAFNMTWYFQGLLRFRLPAAIELAGLSISTVLILLLVKTPGDAWLIPGVLLLVSVLSFLVQLRLAYASSPGFALHPGKPFTTIRAATLLFFDRGVSMLLGPVSILLLGLVAPAAQVAWFAVAERLMGVLSAILGPLNQVFTGMLSKSVGQMRQGAAKQTTYRLMRRVCGYSTGLHIVIAVGALLTADRLVTLVFGPGFEGVVPIFKILCIALLALGIGSVLVSAVLFPLRLDRDIALVSVSRTAVTLGLVLLAGASLGGIGGGWARLFGASAAVLVAVLLLHRRGMLTAMLQAR